LHLKKGQHSLLISSTSVGWMTPHFKRSIINMLSVVKRSGKR